jgi:hypothetical protein
MLLVEPWCPVVKNPESFRLRWGVSSTYNTASLPMGCGTVPTDNETILTFCKIRDFIKEDEVVRVSLVFLFVFFMLTATYIYLLIR